MKKLLTILLAVVLFTGCTQTKTADTLTILTSSGYPPFEMVDTEGKLIGFDIELGEAIAKQMGYDEVKWVDMDFDGIIGDLNSPTGTGDMSLAGFNAAPDRGVLFSDAYYNDGKSPYWVLTLAANNWSDGEDLKDKTVGIQIGTVQAGAVDLIADDFNLVKDARKDIGQMVQEIINGRIDWILVDKVVADEYIASYPQMTTFELQNEKFTNMSYNAVALPLDSELLDDVNAAIAALKADGQLDALIAKWFTE